MRSYSADTKIGSMSLKCGYKTSEYGSIVLVKTLQNKTLQSLLPVHSGEAISKGGDKI
mgnify:CR=1 FL=1